ncbi:MAG: hypothetical protein EGR88_08080 [Ruminococcus sp. SR1/5]|nr:hypothetical protein [Ruminococcus sp.]
MYTVKAFADGEEYVLHDPKQNLYVGDGYFETGDNINGQAEFTVYPDHPDYEYVKKLTTDVVFYNDGVPEFYGRILYDDEDDFSGAKKVFCEGELAFFCDSIQPIKVYQDYTVKQYLQDLIDIHNSQVEERKQFVLGRVTVTDSNDSLYRYSNYDTTRELMSDRLTDRLGGHFVIRHENGVRLLDYLSDEDFYKKNTQTIEFAKNLLDFSRNIDASEIATRIIPLGAKKEDSENDVGILEDRLTIADVNGGVIYVTDDNAVKEYGKITKVVTWDDVTVPENLMKKGREYLKSTQYEKMILELKAIDMNLLDKQVEEFQIGDKIRCISKQNGLDREFPLEKKKIYISDFSKNTVTLGDSTSNKTYTSSNAQTTANMEETIKSMPSKKEILKEAYENAQKLINGQTKNGHAIHVPEEFIVADDEEYKTKASNLWRWGLGGLAHYSQGYDGPIDGIALTMDGKINGKMIMAQSIMAETLDVGYRTSVENAISEAESAANSYTDGREKAMMQEVESSLKVLNDQIAMKISSTKELVLRKNYISGGEQETLSKDAFTITGDVATVTEAEFLNLNCLKVEFNNTGSIVIEQNVGDLPEGIYRISVETAYPLSDGNAKRPYYLEYGFTGNRSTEYYSGYEADEFHSFTKKLEITAASKAVSVKIYGNKGNVAYITNIRCLREIQEFLDELTTQIKEEVGRIELSVKNTLKSYSTTEEMNSAIQLAADNITSTVSKTYVTTSTYETGISDVKKDSTTKANNALKDAKADTESKLKSYSTTEEMKSAIKQSAESITSTVSKTYVTTTTYETGISDAKADTDNKLKNYSTTTEMNSAIKQAADRITSTVKTVRVGSRNLILNSKGDKKAGFFQNFDKVANGYGEITLKSKKTYARVDIASGFLYTCRDYTVGEEVTWSYDIMYTAWNFPSGADRQELWIGQRYTTAPSGETATGIWTAVTKHDLPIVGKNGCKLNKWYHVTQTLTIPAQASANVAEAACIQFYNSSSSAEASFTARIRNVKLEKGNVATDWTPAPEDIDKNIAAVSDKFADYSTTTEMKSAIKQSADAISSTVSKKVGTDEIISKINQSAESVSIKASKINFNGLVTANSYFKILRDGSFACVKGTIGGFTIKNGSIFAKGTELSAIGNGFKIDGGLKIYCGSDTFSDQTDTFQVFNLGHVTSGGHLVFASDGTTVAYLSSSSKRYKDHVADMTIAEAEKMLNVPVVWFKYKENYLSPDDWLNGKKLPGFYAEDVYDIFPEAAQLNEDGEPEDWNFRVIIPAMMKLIQELYSERRKME